MVTLETAGGPIQSPLPPPPPHKPPESSQQQSPPIFPDIPLQHQPLDLRNNPGTQTNVDRHGPNADHTPNPAAVTEDDNDHPTLPPTPLTTPSTRDRRRIVRIHRDSSRSQPTTRSTSIRLTVGNMTHTTQGTTATTTSHTSSQQYTKTKKKDSILLTRSTHSTTATISTSLHSLTTSSRHSEAPTHSAQADRLPTSNKPIHCCRTMSNPAPYPNNTTNTTCDPDPQCSNLRTKITDATPKPQEEMLATDTLAHKITYSPSGTTMITTACHPVTNGPNTNDSTIISKTTMQSGIQRNPTITATIDPELIKVIRTSHDAIQQQIEAIQTTLQTMITVLNRNILPPQTTELPSADRPISEISPTPDRTTIDTPKLLLLFDLANSGQSPHTEIDAPALPLKHSEPQYRDYYLPLSLLPTRRARRHWFPLHQTHQRTSALSSEICLLPTPFPTILRHNDLSMHQAANTDLLWKQSSYDFYYIHKYGTDCTLQLCTFYRPISTAPMMIQPLRNDPSIRLRHYWYQYYTQAPLLPYEPNPTKTDYIAPA